MLEIGYRQEDTAMVLDLAGDFDADSQGSVNGMVESCARDSYKNIIWNFGGVRSINSSGIAILLNAYGDIKKNGAITKLCSVSPDVLEVFGIHKVIPVFDIFPDEGTARKRIQLDMKEKESVYARLFERIDVELKAKYREFTKDAVKGQGKSHVAEAKSLSMCGIFLKTGDTFAKDTLLETTLVLPGLLIKPHVTFLAKVAWVADRERQPELFPGMALCTLFLKDEEKAKLEKFISSRGA